MKTPLIVYTAFRQITVLLVVGLIMVLCLFAQSVALQRSARIASLIEGVNDMVVAPKTQWLIYSCLFFYITTLIFIEWRLTGVPPWRPGNPSLWIFLCAIVAALHYALGYPESAIPPEALIFLGGILLGHLTSIWLLYDESRRSSANHHRFILLLLAFLLWSSSLMQFNQQPSFSYLGHERWSGPWGSPNCFGLIMGTGIVLVLGLATGISHPTSTNRLRVGTWTFTDGGYFGWVVTSALLLASIFMVKSLVHTYSRGAWLATLCGLVYLTVDWLRTQKLKVYRRIYQNIISLVFIGISIGVLSFWYCRHTEWGIARRAFSVANVNDFSWRNRIAAYEGALQVTADHRYFGVGWNRPEQVYQNYYLAPRLTESAAIQMNDYLMLGATLGFPALFCFGMYIWLSLAQKSRGISQIESTQIASQFAACRAGAIVLLVGTLE